MTAAGSPTSDAGPLDGVRILEIASGRPGRIAAMLLADLGADVVRAVLPDAVAEPVTPETLCWDRGKRCWAATPDEIVTAAGRADVVIVGLGPTELARRGWDAGTLRSGTDLVHVWLPPYAERGEWCDLPEDPLLAEAVSGVPYCFPADDASPVAAIAPSLTYVHAALGAAAAVAGLVGRSRKGIGQSAVVSGLHAASTVIGTSWIGFLGGPRLSPGRDGKGSPNWRLYRCSDGEWIFLAALTPDIFLRALDVLDCLEVMALPEVGGDWMTIMDLKTGRPVVTAVMEPIFASDSSVNWQRKFREARVPCAIVQSRADWIDGPIVAANEGRCVLSHPELGAVTMPSSPVTVSGAGAPAYSFAVPQPDGELPWPDERRPRRGSVDDVEPALPLQGLRVVDGTSFVAGPSASTLLADFGADVVRLEPPSGDTYRAYSLSFLVANQRKRGVVIDLKDASGVAELHALLAEADIYIENLRPRALAALELDSPVGGTDFSRLVHCSLSAFGQAQAYADLPGFDPVFQVLSGLAAAQGSPGLPEVIGAPFNDVTTGALAALGSLALVYHRLESKPADAGQFIQRVWVSLAATSSYMQSGEFTSWAGSPAPRQGSTLYRGPGEGHRYYRCADGWIAVAALNAVQLAGLETAVGARALGDVEAALAAQDVATAIEALASRGVPACRVVLDSVQFDDPFLVANEFSQLVPMDQGVARIVAHYSSWPDAPAPIPTRFFELGEHTTEVFAELGSGDRQ